MIFGSSKWKVRSKSLSEIEICVCERERDEQIERMRE